MLNSIFQRLTIAVATITLGSLIIKISSVQAATITYDFTTDLVSGYRSAVASELGIPDNQELITGFFSYDDSTLTAMGEEIVRLNEGPVAFLNSSFWMQSNLRGPGSNTFATFNNGELIGLTADFIPVSFAGQSFEVFSIRGQQITSTFSVEFRPSGVVIAGTLSSNVQYFLRDRETTSIPEPNTVLGTCIFGLVGLLKLAKKKRLLDY